MPARRRGSEQLALDGFGAAGPKPVARVRRAVDVQIRQQRRMKQLEKVDDGLIAVARTLADAMDAEWIAVDGSRFTVGSIAARLVPVLLELRGERYDRDGAGAVDAELAALVTAFRNAPRPDA